MRQARGYPRAAATYALVVKGARIPPSNPMDIRDPDGVRAALREAIQNQITANDPPETRQTFGRLITAGFAEEDTWRLLSAVLAVELAAIVQAAARSVWTPM